MTENKTGFLGKAKAAGQLVAKQTQHMKLGNSTLPKAFLALGKHLYDSGERREDFGELYQRIDTTKAEIRAIEGHRKDQPKAEGMSAKAKAAASGAKDMAQIQLLERKTSTAFSELGKSVYEALHEQAGPTELVQPIGLAIEKLKSLDGEIAELSEASKGQLITPKRLAISGVAAAALLVVIVGLSLLSSGDGPYESWNDEMAQREQRELDRLAQAHQLWDQGKHEDAVDLYVGMIADDVMIFRGMNNGDKHPDTSKVFRRTIEYQIEKGGLEAGFDCIYTAIALDIPIALKTPEANAYVMRVREKYEQNQTEARARRDERRRLDRQKESHARSSSSSGGYSYSSSDDEEISDAVRAARNQHGGAGGPAEKNIREIERIWKEKGGQ